MVADDHIPEVGLQRVLKPKKTPRKGKFIINLAISAISFGANDYYDIIN